MPSTRHQADASSSKSTAKNQKVCRFCGSSDHLEYDCVDFDADFQSPIQKKSKSIDVSDPKSVISTSKRLTRHSTESTSKANTLPSLPSHGSPKRKVSSLFLSGAKHTSETHFADTSKCSKDNAVTADSAFRQSSNASATTIPTDLTDVDDIVCDVCGDGSQEADNMIIICELCGVPVHQTCYGVETIPQDEWYCNPCSILHKQINNNITNSSKSNESNESDDVDISDFVAKNDQARGKPCKFSKTNTDKDVYTVPTCKVCHPDVHVQFYAGSNHTSMNDNEDSNKRIVGGVKCVKQVYGNDWGRTVTGALKPLDTLTGSYAIDRHMFNLIASSLNF
jgi:hypothetical protein